MAGLPGEELASVPRDWLLLCLWFQNQISLREPTLPYIPGRVGYKFVWFLVYGLRAHGAAAAWDGPRLRRVGRSRWSCNYRFHRLALDRQWSSTPALSPLGEPSRGFLG
jgi:hypothetical protein